VKNRIICSVCAGALLLVCAPLNLTAQRATTGVRRPGEAARRPADAVENMVRVRKLSGVGRVSLVRTPVFRTNQPAGTRPVGEWAQIATQYDTSPDWIDELVFQYYVMTMESEGGANVYSFFRKVVRYVDIERDNNHMSTVFLHPRTLERYGDVVAVAVEITLGGQVAAAEDEVDGGRVRLPENWWTNPNVLQNENLTIRDGYLLGRDETPFALINIDDYEVIK